MKKSKQVFLGVVMASAMIWHPYNAMAGTDGHNHAPGEVHKEDEHGHAENHVEESHFNIEVPASLDAVWESLDKSVNDARTAVTANDTKALHEASEKLSMSVSGLHKYPKAVKEGNGEKWNSILGQLTKTADRFHHVAEDNDLAAATEALDILESQIGLIRSLY